jgi:hypothetical protein
MLDSTSPSFHQCHAPQEKDMIRRESWQAGSLVEQPTSNTQITGPMHHEPLLEASWVFANGSSRVSCEVQAVDCYFAL